jgi:hypothetical protein
MGRKKIIDGKEKTLSTRLPIKEINKIKLISNVLGMRVARFIRMCIQEWISNHSEFMKIIDDG